MPLTAPPGSMAPPGSVPGFVGALSNPQPASGYVPGAAGAIPPGYYPCAPGVQPGPGNPCYPAGGMRLPVRTSNYFGTPGYPGQWSYAGPAGYGSQPSYTGAPGYPGQGSYPGAPSYGSQPGYPGAPSYGSQPRLREPVMGVMGRQLPVMGASQVTPERPAIRAPAGRIPPWLAVCSRLGAMPRVCPVHHRVRRRRTRYRRPAAPSPAAVLTAAGNSPRRWPVRWLKRWVVVAEV